MAKHLLYYKSKVSITDVDENETYTDYFDEIYENDWYIVIDKWNIGEEMGAEIIEKIRPHRELFVTDDDDFTDDFKNAMLKRVEEAVTDDLRNEICEHMLDYLGNNLW